MSRFQCVNLSINGLVLVERQRIGDDRGHFSRLFCALELGSAGWHRPVVQINHTMTRKKGTVRGLHFQRPPHAEMKLVSCLRGEIWDVAVDVRADSPTFLLWHAETLSAENGRALLIPEGFAHGFQSLSDNVELIYCHSAAYEPTSETGLSWNDPALNIAWPLPITEMSARDRAHPLIGSDFQGIAV